MVDILAFFFELYIGTFVKSKCDFVLIVISFFDGKD